MNYCTECGNKVEEGSRFCGSCGHDISSESDPIPVTSLPSQQLTPNQQYYNKPDNTKGIISLVFGILGFVFIPIIGSIVAIIMGVIARNQEDEPTLGNIGLGLGIAGLLCWIVFLVFIFGFILSMMSMYPPYY